MVYNGANLVMDFQYGPVRVWNYSTSDNVSSVDAGTYFDTVDAFSKLRQGDWLQVTAADGKALYLVDGMSEPDGVAHTKTATVTTFV
jgi:hypothetical protein